MSYTLNDLRVYDTISDEDGDFIQARIEMPRTGFHDHHIVIHAFNAVAVRDALNVLIEKYGLEGVE